MLAGPTMITAVRKALPDRGDQTFGMTAFKIGHWNLFNHKANGRHSESSLRHKQRHDVEHTDRNPNRPVLIYVGDEMSKDAAEVAKADTDGPEYWPLSRPPKVVLMTLPTDKAASDAAATREIVDFIRAEVGAIDLTADSSLQSSGLDSVKVMSLVFKLESRYEISLDPEDADDIRTVGDLANLVVRRLQERA